VSVSVASAIRLSLWVGAWCTLLGLPIAVVLGWFLARYRFPGKSIASAVVLAPLVLPPVVTGLLLLTWFGKHGWLGARLAALGLPIPFTLAGAVLAALVVGLPLTVMVARGAFEAVDPRLEDVSQTLGVPPARTFFRVTLPLALPGLAAGAILAFARSLGEFGATAVLAGNVEGHTRTISMAIYSLLDMPGGDRRIWTLVWASLLISVAAILGFEALVRRQMQRLEVWRGR
jgi:molybdate transport system permease protein